MGIHWDWLKWRQRITRLGKQLNKWAISRPLSRYTLREVNMLIFGLKQEPITRSVQLAYFLATAFSQVCLSTAEVTIGPYSSVAEDYIVYWGKCIQYYVLARVNVLTLFSVIFQGDYFLFTTQSFCPSIYIAVLRTFSFFLILFLSSSSHFILTQKSFIFFITLHIALNFVSRWKLMQG